ncbi:hypothetical protein AALP_AA6G360200 [Arabis alpina]|uniref:Uncharacterized protein n=1 Tax=Arabis alpina TaxID=50452 RepID=A0A087GTX1_ARAAL|nr:hypothetical protein AALP_AA6G360200 [Arabis alpina]
MISIEPPSFSLGFDLDVASDPHRQGGGRRHRGVGGFHNSLDLPNLVKVDDLLLDAGEKKAVGFGWSNNIWDYFCCIIVSKDYFSSIKTAQKQSSAVATSSSNSGFCQQSLDFSPPSHRFFMHSDPRIQNLPNFLPLGIFNDREVFLIDYMNQFGSNGSGDSSRRVQTKSKVSKGQESYKAAPKGADKRCVSANTASTGDWFTSPEGRKVFISKSGQEFSGQSAYRCYRKETGGGFHKSRKKRQPTKKAKN